MSHIFYDSVCVSVYDIDRLDHHENLINKIWSRRTLRAHSRDSYKLRSQPRTPTTKPKWKHPQSSQPPCVPPPRSPRRARSCAPMPPPPRRARPSSPWEAGDSLTQRRFPHGARVPTQYFIVLNMIVQKLPPVKRDMYASPSWARAGIECGSQHTCQNYEKIRWDAERRLRVQQRRKRRIK